MKSLVTTLTVLLFVAAPALQAGDACCEKTKASATACEKAKATECSKAKASCCEKDLALRKALLTHKGASLVKR